MKERMSSLSRKRNKTKQPLSLTLCSSYALGRNNGYGAVKLAKQVGVSGIGDIIPP